MARFGDFQLEIYLGGLDGTVPALPMTAAGLAEAAQEVMTPEAYGYVAGSAGTESTATANVEGLVRWEIVARHLRGVDQRDLTTELLGRRLPAPVLLAPVGVLGICHPDDARQAVDAGVDAIIVSNHGGRQVDGARAAIDCLPGAVAAAGDLPVLFDSGIRSGSDVVKALALGARAVLLGRPYVYGLALAGADGVRHAVRCLLAELDLTLGLAGHATPASLGPDDLVHRS